MADAERPALLLYAGDFDPSGEDIRRDFIAKTDCWDETVVVALDAEQVRAYDLPVNPGKEKDSRSAAFAKKYGALMQVELDAVPPEELRRLFEAQINRYWNPDIAQAVLDEEVAHLAALRRLQKKAAR